MTTTIFYQIRTLKHQIKATLKLIADGILFYIDQLIILEGKLEKLESSLNTPDSAKVVTFGKYKGSCVRDIPTDYLAWAMRSVPNYEWRYVFRKEVLKRNKNEENLIKLREEYSEYFINYAILFKAERDYFNNQWKASNLPQVQQEKFYEYLAKRSDIIDSVV